MKNNSQKLPFIQEEEKFHRGAIGRNNIFGKPRKYKGGPPPQKRYQKKQEGIKQSSELGFQQYNKDEWFDGRKLIFYAKFYQKMVPGIAQAQSKQKDYYFSSYSHYHIHQQMICDKVRTQSYQRAMLNNKATFKDKIVLDVGCGTGILSIFAMNAGAKHVYGIDMADVALYAKQIMIDNNFQEKITIIKGKVQDIDLQKDYGLEGKVDIIISQWMGYMLLYQSMLDTVLYARDRWLKPDGILLPQKVSLSIVGIEDEEYKRNKYSFWDKVYDVDMSCMKRGALSQVLVDGIDKEQICTTSFKFWEADLRYVKIKDLDFSNQYHIRMMRNDNLYALAVWFDVEFSGMDKIERFSTGPYSPMTHWQQTVLYLNSPIYSLKYGEQIDGSIAFRKGKKNFREIDVKFSLHYFPTSVGYNDAERSNQDKNGQHQVCQLKMR